MKNLIILFFLINVLSVSLLAKQSDQFNFSIKKIHYDNGVNATEYTPLSAILGSKFITIKPEVKIINLNFENIKLFSQNNERIMQINFTELKIKTSINLSDNLSIFGEIKEIQTENNLLSKKLVDFGYKAYGIEYSIDL